MCSPGYGHAASFAENGLLDVLPFVGRIIQTAAMCIMVSGRFWFFDPNDIFLTKLTVGSFHHKLKAALLFVSPDGRLDAHPSLTL